MLPPPRACLTMCAPAWLREVPVAGAVRAACCVMGLRLRPVLGTRTPPRKLTGPGGLQVHWMGQDCAQHPAAHPYSSPYRSSVSFLGRPVAHSGGARQAAFLFATDLLCHPGSRPQPATSAGTAIYSATPPPPPTSGLSHCHLPRLIFSHPPVPHPTNEASLAAITLAAGLLVSPAGPGDMVMLWCRCGWWQVLGLHCGVWGHDLSACGSQLQVPCLTLVECAGFPTSVSLHPGPVIGFPGRCQCPQRVCQHAWHRWRFPGDMSLLPGGMCHCPQGACRGAS